MISVINLNLVPLACASEIARFMCLDFLKKSTTKDRLLPMSTSVFIVHFIHRLLSVDDNVPVKKSKT